MLPVSFLFIKLDLLGRGHSDAPCTSYTEDLFVSQLNKLIDHIFGKDKSVNLVGYSLGGGISATFASRCPERVSRLVLMAPAGAGTQIPLIAQYDFVFVFTLASFCL